MRSTTAFLSTEAPYSEALGGCACRFRVTHHLTAVFHRTTLEALGRTFFLQRLRISRRRLGFSQSSFGNRRSSSLAVPSRCDLIKSSFSPGVIFLVSIAALRSSRESFTGCSPSVLLPMNFFNLFSRCNTTIFWYYCVDDEGSGVVCFFTSFRAFCAAANFSVNSWTCLMS